MPYFIIAVLLVLADQWVKAWTVANFVSPAVGVPTAKEFLPGLVELTRVHNYGAGWSSFSGQRWFLAVVSAVVVGLVLYVVLKRIVRHPLGLTAAALVVAGGIGNLIDRVRLGYVVDMFNLEFMNYPVFNIADIFVVCGAFVFAFYYLVLHDKVTAQTQKKTEEAGDDGNDHAES